jgi:histone deacetylase 1/2
VWLLHKDLYGLKQAGHDWYQTIRATLLSLGWTVCTVDPCVFVLSSTQSPLYLVLYVDDLAICAPTEALATAALKALFAIHPGKMLGHLHFLLGIQIRRTGDQLYMDQHAAINRFLSSMDLPPTPVTTPTIIRQKLLASLSQAPSDVILKYQAAIGSLLYISRNTRPDLSFLVGLLGRFASNPDSSHVDALTYASRYLKSTLKHCIKFEKSDLTLIGYSDADWASDLNDRRSTTGYCIYLGKNLISWSSRKQKSVALSTMEAEFVALSETAKEIKWIQSLLEDLGFSIPTPIIYCDNEAALALSSNPTSFQRAKHIDIKYFYLRDLVQSKSIVLKKVSSELNTADIFTKALAGPVYNRHCNSLCLSEDPSFTQSSVRGSVGKGS